LVLALESRKVIFLQAIKAIVEWCGKRDEASLQYLNGLTDIVLCVSDIDEASILTKVCDTNLEGQVQIGPAYEFLYHEAAMRYVACNHYCLCILTIT
jgi:hypothetical protein